MTNEEAATLLERVVKAVGVNLNPDEEEACRLGAAALRSPAPGAAAMREAAARVCDREAAIYAEAHDVLRRDACDDCAGEIRALPLPAREVPEVSIQISALLWCPNCQKARIHERIGLDICCTDCHGVAVTEHD